MNRKEPRPRASGGSIPIDGVLDAFLAAKPEPYYVRDLHYNVVLWSPQMEEMTGYTADETLGRKCYEIFHRRACEHCPVQNPEAMFRDVLVVTEKKDGTP